MNWRRLGLAAAYPLILIVTTLVFRSRPEGARRAWLDWTSTNLVNLRDHPVAAMVTSGMYTEGSLLVWAVLALVGLGVLSASLGIGRAWLVVATAHVVGTLVSEGILAARIAAGQAPASDRFIVDVGPSYVVTGALVAGACYGVRWWRLAALAGFVALAPSLFNGLPDLEVSSVGHACAVLVALILAFPMRHTTRPHPPAPMPAPMPAPIKDECGDETGESPAKRP